MNVNDTEWAGPWAALFIIVWHVTWFFAIWIFHIQFFLTGLFCLILAIVFKSIYDDGQKKKKEEKEKENEIGGMRAMF